MALGLRVGVLSPFVGGDYYGTIIAGVDTAARADGGRLIAVQTLDPGSIMVDGSEVPDVRLPIAWQHFDAAVVVGRAITADGVRRVQGAGKPVVMISDAYPDVDCPVVSVANREGVREAVAHLAGHGHERIGFAGFFEHPDVNERYEGYLDAMTELGLESATHLLFEAPDNHETGGTAIGAQLLGAAQERGGALPVTALVVGTDRNVMGLMPVLTAAGYALPADLALVGFDDILEAAHLRPGLATVRQPLTELGALTYEHLRRLVTGTSAPHLTNTVPAVLVPRESCGCPPDPRAAALRDDRDWFHDHQVLQATLSTQYALGVELLSTHRNDPRELAWVAHTPAAAASLGLWPGTAAGSDGDADDPVAVPTSPTDPDPQIEVVGGYRTDGRSTSVGSVLPVSAFPPVALFETADAATGQIVFVVPVRSGSHDWGALATVDRIRSLTPPGRELVSNAAALLGIALDHEAVLRSLKQQKDRLRRAALYDNLTGLPNRTLLLDRLRQSAHRAARRPDRQFALLFLDLDEFKAINDTLGHAAGDHVLVETARRLRSTLRRTDTAARMGGDEFVVLLDGLWDGREATLAADRVRDAVTQPLRIENRTVNIGVSIGISRSDEGSLDADELLRRADSSMYAAKTAARLPAPPDDAARG